MFVYNLRESIRAATTAPPGAKPPNPIHIRKGALWPPSAFLEDLMSKPKTKKRVAHHRGGLAVVLFGLDEAGKPRAASFPAAQAGLAIKAAERLKLHVLKVRDQAQIGLAAQLPTGQVHANGKALVRPIRTSQFERLCAVAKVSVQSKSLGPPADKAGGNGSSEQPPDQSRPATRQLPRSWDEIDVGHIVV